jgi:hypothetical protein
MNLVDPRARVRWRAFEKRARLALMDVPASMRRSLLSDLEAHVTEALTREQPGVSEHELIERVLTRIGDPVRFLRPLLEETSRSTAARSQRRWPLAKMAAALLSAAGAIALIGFGGNALSCPGGVGLFQLGSDEFQIRLLCGPQEGNPIGAPWLAIACMVMGALLAGWCWWCVLRVRVALLLRRSDDESQ